MINHKYALYTFFKGIIKFIAQLLYLLSNDIQN